MRSYIPGKKNHISDYFKYIDSETKAYILGYIVADGSIEESVRKNDLSKDRSFLINKTFYPPDILPTNNAKKIQRTQKYNRE